MKRQHKLVEIVWDDAHNGTAGWNTADDAIREGSAVAVCSTVGFVIVDKPDVLTVVGTVSYGENGSLEQVNGVMSIPRGMVRKVRVLK